MSESKPAPTCEYGYPKMCGKPAVWVGMMPKYPESLYACEEHKLPMFGDLALNTSELKVQLKFEDYRALRDRYGAYSRIQP